MIGGDSDADGCDDCAVGSDGFGPLPDSDPANDGLDTDGDGVKDPGEPGLAGWTIVLTGEDVIVNSDGAGTVTLLGENTYNGATVIVPGTSGGTGSAQVVGTHSNWSAWAGTSIASRASAERVIVSSSSGRYVECCGAECGTRNAR